MSYGCDERTYVEESTNGTFDVETYTELSPITQSFYKGKHVIGISFYTP